ncbi:Regulator of telomere elongation helicase 1 [Morus notabilis]|uniref:Regulator of telomere elongation helicase 1 n=1 Tax=Morus notabilis TaxID=981085 RepID=W9RUS6_9ROSA|nr:Regulator of telomere elongation helicase 1 [Morus notabilis]
MPTYKIRGIDVDFPFEAYDCQLVYMDKVIQSLQNKCNALLESPTGTGKTLCLLCATLAWRKSLGSFSTGISVSSSQYDSKSQSSTPKLPTIAYTSRTHSQIRQVIQELKRTSYRPKMVVLGSREQLCIHDTVSSLHGKAQSNACLLLRKSRHQDEKHEKQEKRASCAHYYHVADYLKSNPHLGDEPIDIEDLVNIGKSSGPCPYYMSREIHKVVDILFAPYNYLIDRGYRKSLNLNFKNSILIFDEAHNLESLCADAASFDLPYWLLTACISEAKNCIDISVTRREISDDKSNNPDNYAILRELFPGEMAAKKMDALGERLESEVEEMKTTIEGRFSAMEGRFNNVEGRFNNLEEMLKKLMDLHANPPAAAGSPTPSTAAIDMAENSVRRGKGVAIGVEGTPGEVGSSLGMRPRVSFEEGGVMGPATAGADLCRPSAVATGTGIADSQTRAKPAIWEGKSAALEGVLE